MTLRGEGEPEGWVRMDMKGKAIVGAGVALGLLLAGWATTLLPWGHPEGGTPGDNPAIPPSDGGQQGEQPDLPPSSGGDPGDTPEVPGPDDSQDEPGGPGDDDAGDDDEGPPTGPPGDGPGDGCFTPPPSWGLSLGGNDKASEKAAQGRSQDRIPEQAQTHMPEICVPVPPPFREAFSPPGRDVVAGLTGVLVSGYLGFRSLLGIFG
jgi:hypothetical protein